MVCQYNAATTSHDINNVAWPSAVPWMNHGSTSTAANTAIQNVSPSKRRSSCTMATHIRSDQNVSNTERTYHASEPRDTGSRENGTMRMANGGGYT